MSSLRLIVPTEQTHWTLTEQSREQEVMWKKDASSWAWQSVLLNMVCSPNGKRWLLAFIDPSSFHFVMGTVSCVTREGDGDADCRAQGHRLVSGFQSTVDR